MDPFLKNERDTPREPKKLPTKIKLQSVTKKDSHVFLILLSLGSVYGLLIHFNLRSFDVKELMIIILVFITISWYLDEYYVLDVNKQSLMLKGHNSYTKFVGFNEIVAVIANGMEVKSSHPLKSREWVYQTQIILESGKSMVFGKTTGEGYATADQRAKVIADITGAEYFQGELEYNAEVILKEEKYTFKVNELTPEQKKFIKDKYTAIEHSITFFIVIVSVLIILGCIVFDVGAAN